MTDYVPDELSFPAPTHSQVDRLHDKCNSLGGERDALLQQRDALADHVKRMHRALMDLVSESSGVYGLHQNGDLAPWDTLMAGGEFEEWLRVFEDNPFSGL